jgi:hypothetical protein
MDQDLFLYYLLQRVAEIQQSISVTLPNDKVVQAKYAYPRWWEPIGNMGFPGFYNRGVRLNSQQQGAPIQKRQFRITMRLVAGPAFAGYRGEYEDQGNILYNAVLNRFDRERKLAAPGSPPDNTPLQFVEWSSITQPDNGFTGIAFDEKRDSTYLCCDFPLDVVANFQVFRNS